MAIHYLISNSVFLRIIFLARQFFNLLNLISETVFIVCIMAAPAGAEAEELIQFDMPEQDLARALFAFTGQTHVQVLYEGNIAQGLRSAPLKGSYTPQRALQVLLSESPVQARFTGYQTVTLERKAEPIGYVADAGDATELGAVTVTGKGVSQPDDPYNADYNRTNATTATKTDMPIMETPLSIQIVPQQVLKDQQAIRLQDATKNVSGVQQTSGFGDFYDQFVIRGFDSGTNIVRFRNGARIPNMTFEMANIDQVEVLKGPASILYGRIEPGGLINAVTKKPLAEPFYALQQQFGSYDFYRTTLDATGPITDDGSLLYRFDLAYQNNNSFRDFMGKERIFVAPSLTWRPTDALELNLNVEYRDDDTVFDPGIPAIIDPANPTNGRPANVPKNRSFVIPGSFETFTGPLVEFNWSFRFNDQWKLRNGITATFVDNEYAETFPLGVTNRSLPLFLGIGDSIRDNYAAFLELNGNLETLGVQHNVLLGLDTYYQRTTFHTFARGVFGEIEDIYNPVYPSIDIAAIPRNKGVNAQDYRDEWYGIYFQDQLTIFDRLHILAGGRYDWAGVSSGTINGNNVSLNDIKLDTLHAQKFTPRFGMVYQVQPWLSLYANYVESFGANNGRSANGRPFAPQSAQQYEGGIKTNFFDGRLTGTLAFFHITKDNLLTRDLNSTDPRNQRAIGEARSQGIEFDMAGAITDQVSLIATYAYTDARITKDLAGNQGNRLRLASEHTASFWLKYQPVKGLDLGSGIYLASQRQGNFANTFQLPGYARWDAMAAYRFEIGKSNLTAQVNVNNILNKTYYLGDVYEIGGLPAEPLTVLGSLRLEY